MSRLTPQSKRTDTLFPDTTLFRSRGTLDRYASWREAVRESAEPRGACGRRRHRRLFPRAARRSRPQLRQVLRSGGGAAEPRRGVQLTQYAPPRRRRNEDAAAEVPAYSPRNERRAAARKCQRVTLECREIGRASRRERGE